MPVFDVSAEHTRGAHIVSVKDAPPGSARNLVVFDTTSGPRGVLTSSSFLVIDAVNPAREEA